MRQAVAIHADPTGHQIRIGTAGWAIGSSASSHFPPEGSNLERYAQVLPVTEINSSFHRPHRIATWERWRDSVPPAFRFSVKIPKSISHERKLVGCTDLVTQFLEQVDALGEKLAVLLLQLPPKLSFEPTIAGDFLEYLCLRSAASIVVEPRHISWFGDGPDSLLRSFQVGRVAADPAICSAAAVPGGWRSLQYWRLHGSPIKYRSAYLERLPFLADTLAHVDGEADERWCIFDNTASSAAIADAVELQAMLGRNSDRPNAEAQPIS